MSDSNLVWCSKSDAMGNILATLVTETFAAASQVHTGEFGAPGCTCPDGIDGIDDHYTDCVFVSDLTRARRRMHNFTIQDSIEGSPVLRCANYCRTIWYPWRIEPTNICTPPTPRKEK